MTSIAIAWHSGYGHTRKLAEAVSAGAGSVPGVRVASIDVAAIDAAGWDALARADAIVFGAPTYMGGPSAPFKVFADATATIWLTQGWRDKVAGGFTCSLSMSGDKYSTLMYMTTLAMQHGMVWVGTGMMPANSKAAQRNDVNWMGSFAGAMSQSPSDSSPAEGPPPGDLETARLFGQRVAETAARWNR